MTVAKPKVGLKMEQHCALVMRFPFEKTQADLSSLESVCQADLFVHSSTLPRCNVPADADIVQHITLRSETQPDKTENWCKNTAGNYVM